MSNPVTDLLFAAWSTLALEGLFWGIPAMLVLGLPWIRKPWAQALFQNQPWLVCLGTWLTWACWLFIPAHWIVANFPTNERLATERIIETMCIPPHAQAFSVATALALLPAIVHAQWLLKDPILRRGRTWLSALFLGMPLLPALLSFSLALSAEIMEVTSDEGVKSGALDDVIYQDITSPPAAPDAK